jgi:hydroxymethylglutaryl-CoA reductase (NADPH)
MLIGKPHVERRNDLTSDAVAARLAQTGIAPDRTAALADPFTVAGLAAYAHSAENFIGTVKVPVGLAGPLRMRGKSAIGDYYVPLATSEAALVASYSRGMQIISEAGGCAASVTAESVSRSPGFAFDSLADAECFAAWSSRQTPACKAVVAQTTRHGALTAVHPIVEGNHVYLRLEFTTGEAAGQNMVTIAAEAVCAYLADNSPTAIIFRFVEANFSSDKKASMMSLLGVRGKRACAEAVIEAGLLRDRLHVDASVMLEYWKMGAVGAAVSGTIGIQGHYANCLAALFVACGQDVACVAEASIGITRFDERADGSLYACVTLPNLIVGTIGGGTGLPSQRACLDILGLSGPGSANALAEICAGVCLAGELSITGALCAGEFTRAHARLGRRDAGV